MPEICHARKRPPTTYCTEFGASSDPLGWRRSVKFDGVSNHRRLYWLLNRLLWRRSRKISKLRITSLCEGNPPVTGGFSTQRASNVENVSILVTSSCLLHTGRPDMARTDDWVNYKSINVFVFQMVKLDGSTENEIESASEKKALY